MECECLSEPTLLQTIKTKLTFGGECEPLPLWKWHWDMTWCHVTLALSQSHWPFWNEHSQSISFWHEHLRLKKSNTQVIQLVLYYISVRSPWMWELSPPQLASPQATMWPSRRIAANAADVACSSRTWSSCSWTLEASPPWEWLPQATTVPFLKNAVEHEPLHMI